MATVKKITQNVQVDLSKYHNSETGEELLSELMGDKKILTIKQDTEKVTIDYPDYAVIDSSAILALSQMLSRAELGYVLSMMVTTDTELNVLYNDKVPHSNKTLQQYLKINSESGFIKLIKQLMQKGILYQMKGLIHNEMRVIYLMNPFLCKKRKTFDKRVIEVFSQFKIENK